MTYILKKYNKGLCLVLLTLFSCLTLTFCSKDMDEASLVEVASAMDAKSLYFYGSDAEFEKFKGVEITHINTKQELNNIAQTAGNSFALFVGKDVDVRSGAIDDFRNSGVLVTKLKEKIAEPKKLPAQARLIVEEKSNTANSSNTEINLEEQFQLVSYLSVNGAHKILGSTFERIDVAVPEILAWSREKMKEKDNYNISKSGTKTRETALDFDYMWNNVGDFGLNTEIFSADTDGYMLNDGSGNSEHPHMNIFEHKITATPRTHTSYPASWTVGNIQVIQEPIQTSQVNYSLREFSPLNSSNGVLDGSSGSDSFGYGIDFGFGVDGPDVGGGLDWSHSTDWSIPACQINTYHNTANELFHVMYLIDPNGSWSGNSVTAENYTYYANNGYPSTPYFTSFLDHPMTYFVNMVSDNDLDRDLLIVLDTNRVMKLWKYHGGYFDNPNNNTYEEYSW